MPTAAQKKAAEAKAAEVEKAAEQKTEEPAPAKLPEPEKGCSYYKNSSTVNVFTEGGRCAPGGIIQLTPDQAKQYQGLDLCESA